MGGGRQLPLLAIPNVSEGRAGGPVRVYAEVVSAHARLLDIHSDSVHNRTVFTVTWASNAILRAMVALAGAAQQIDLSSQLGVHPRLGGLDVCPIVPHEQSMEDAIALARRTGSAIAEAAQLPVYFYGRAATRPEARELPSLRRGGISALAERAQRGFLPDAGPRVIDPRRGVICVGARSVLIAFNVWLRSDVATAREIARRIRAADGGLPGVRALGLRMDSSTCQVSMNLVDPERTGINEAFSAARAVARELRCEVIGTEIVGLPPARFMPEANAEAARLLIKPGRSLESVLADV
jgi:glutamate formiminotransferase / 5-formyltetrahydrofolate cyclo-ligase